MATPAPVSASAHVGAVSISSTIDAVKIVTRSWERGFPVTYGVGSEERHFFDFDEPEWEASIRTLSDATA